MRKGRRRGRRKKGLVRTAQPHGVITPLPPPHALWSEYKRASSCPSPTVPTCVYAVPANRNVLSSLLCLQSLESIFQFSGHITSSTKSSLTPLPPPPPLRHRHSHPWVFIALHIPQGQHLAHYVSSIVVLVVSNCSLRTLISFHPT